MKKYVSFLLVLALVASLLCSCAEREEFMAFEGVDYANPSLELEYVSFDKVRVTVAVDILTSGCKVVAHVVLLSENSIIGTCDVEVSYAGKYGKTTRAKDVKLTYHNAGAITAYIDHLSGTYSE